MARRSTPPQRRSDSPLHGHCDVAFYNEVRPHSAIGNKVPAALHRATGTVHRFWEGDGDEVGQLEQRRGNTYAFSFPTASEDDETIYPLADYSSVCSPFVLAQRPVGADSPATRLARLSSGALLPYHLGRLTTYTLLGALAGGFGGVIVRMTGLSTLLAGLLLFAACLFLAQ